MNDEEHKAVRITTGSCVQNENSDDQEGILESVLDGVRVQRVHPRMLDGVAESGYSWCNTCNHRGTEAYEQNQQRFGNNKEDWYQHIMAQTRMEKWISVLGHLVRPPEQILTISAKQQKKYFDTPLCKNIAFQGVRAKELLGDEAKDLANEFREISRSPLTPLTSTSQGWFVRTSACSTKDSQSDGGAGPHFCLENALLSLFASERVHVSMKDYTNDVKVYLVPFDSTVTVAREMRVFVYKHQVTAISQYDVYNDDSILCAMSDAQLAEVAELVNVFHCKNVRDVWIEHGGIDSYVMDVEYDQGGVVRLMELNSFGAEMAAASALFHWVRDANEITPLEPLGKGICFRVRAPNLSEEFRY